MEKNLNPDPIDYVVIRGAKHVEYDKDKIIYQLKDGRKFKVTVKEV